MTIPEAAQQQLDEGMAAIRQGNHQAAIAAWTRALEIAPDYPQAQTNRGAARRALQDFDGALADFDAVLAAHPDHADAYLNRANTYLDKGLITKALDDLNRVIELQPTAVDAYYNRGNTLLRINQSNPKFFNIFAKEPENYRVALADFDQAIALDSRFAPAYAGRAGINFGVLSHMPPPYAENVPQMYRKAEYSHEARQKLAQTILSDLDTAIQLDPGSAEAWKNRGMLYLMVLRQPEKALHDLTKTLDINPNFLDALIFRARVYSQMKRYPEAITDCDRALTIQPQNAALYFNRGINYRLNNQHEQAVADMTRVIDIDANNIPAYANRAESYTALKNKKAAIADWEKYLALGGGKKFGDEAAVQDKLKKLKSFSLFG